MCLKLLDRTLPKKFLYRYPLKAGARCVGVIMLIIMIIVAIATMIQVIYVKKCDQCNFFAWRNCYAYSVIAFIYAIIMIIVNLWFLWGVLKNKSSVVLGWIVLTLIWLTQMFCLLIVLICMYSADTSLASWLAALIFGLIAIAILIYLLMVVVSYWMEIRAVEPLPATTPK